MEGSRSPGIALNASRRFWRGAALAAITAKLFLAWRINVNWDEFFYLSNVHALARGELDLLLQGAYTHLFQWVVDAAADEMGEIMLLRLAMWALLALSAWLVYLLARRWTSAAASAFAALAFACSWPVLKHGASFRADSLLLPLTVGAFYFVARPGIRQHRNDVIAGLCFGVAFTLSTKAALMLPTLAMLAILPDSGESALVRANVLRAMHRLTMILVPAAILSTIVLALHSTQLAGHAESAGNFAVRTISATLLDVPFLPRGDYFARLIAKDPVYWSASLAGTVVAVRWRTYRAAACALALLPILFLPQRVSLLLPGDDGAGSGPRRVVRTGCPWPDDRSAAAGASPARTCRTRTPRDARRLGWSHGTALRQAAETKAGHLGSAQGLPAAGSLI